MPQLKVYLHGDSSTYGYGDPENGGWGAYLKAEMMRRANLGLRPTREIINLALSSQSTDEIVKRLSGQIESYDESTGFAIFMLGAVDAAIWWRTEQIRVPLPEFAANLRKIGDICLQHMVIPIFVGYHDVDESRTNPRRNGDRVTNAQIHEYNSRVQAYAAEVGVRFIDPIYINQYPYEEVLSADGLHPNSTGHKLIYDAVMPVLDIVVENSLTR